jgi:DNA (cytosine-5)-methyltransferase 1
MKHKVLDLFAGIGGFSLGLERTGGFETVAFCEQDEKAKLVLNKNWPTVPVYGDIKELTFERLQADGLIPTVITGGFPCQDISAAGRGEGIIGERSGLWSEMFRLIRDVRPAWAIIENVSVLRSKGLTLVLQNLGEIGYCAEWHCIPASAVGAPHQRDRIWIVAYPMREHSSERGECEITKGEGGGWGNKQAGSQGDVEWERSVRGSGSGAGEDVAHSDRPRLEGWLSTRLQECTLQQPVGTGSSCEGELSDYWKSGSDVLRVADGIPNRVDRLKQLGNAVVPQIPQLLGQAILAAETIHQDN